MIHRVLSALGLFSVVAVVVSYWASLHIARDLSPQGCRMSWMSPSYILQSKFDTSWTPLARRYSLWLYREVGWEGNNIHGGVPVLFIPGNAGSSRQVRSIASSAARQYFISPGQRNEDLVKRDVKPLDIFAAEFNEDLSAFHGPTIEGQVRYTSSAVDFILSLYPQNTSIIIMGHSMGGVVATSLLPHDSIAAVITMSTPHTLPPARFDYRIDNIYAQNQDILQRDPTPILSLCGGATDMMIPSESCILGPNSDAPYRRTVFSSALEGSWTGVGHREMVWCHQVRWRVARAALELAASSSFEGIAEALDIWLWDGRSLPHVSEAPSYQPPNLTASEMLARGQQLVVRNPAEPKTYLLPVSDSSELPQRLTVFVSNGVIPPVSPQKPSGLEVVVSLCTATESGDCRPLVARSHRLIPNPEYGKLFPVPSEGTDESEGVVLFEAEIPPLTNTAWVAVDARHAGKKGWIVAGVERPVEVVSDLSTIGLLLHDVRVPVGNQPDLWRTFRFPNLLSHALMVYRITPRSQLDREPCSEPLLPPLIEHTPNPVETHYFPLTRNNRQPISLHSHGSAPYIQSNIDMSGLEITVYSSGSSGCGLDVHEFDLGIDWPATLGRVATRYFTTVVCWAIAVIALATFGRLEQDHQDQVVGLPVSLSMFCREVYPKLTLASWTVALLPLPNNYYLGLGGKPLFSLLAPLLITIATGLVGLSVAILSVLKSLVALSLLLRRPSREENAGGRRKRTISSLLLLFLLVFLFVPWQVSFLGCWLIQLVNCSSAQAASWRVGRYIPLLQISRPRPPTDPPERHAGAGQNPRLTNQSFNEHLLLLMTWLVPLVAPVLVVWVRTLYTAGLTTPFDSDHFFINVAPFLVVVDYVSRTHELIFEMDRSRSTALIRWSWVALSLAAFVLGPRWTYMVFDAAKIVVGLIVVVAIGPRYWGGSWKSYL